MIQIPYFQNIAATDHYFDDTPWFKDLPGAAKIRVMQAAFAINLDRYDDPGAKEYFDFYLLDDVDIGPALRN